MNLANRRLVVILLVLYNVVSLCRAQYHGKLVGTFTDKSTHDIAGTVYAEDETTLRIIGFRYDGGGPDAFIWAGESGIPSDDGFIIPDEEGRTVKLEAYNNVNISVTLPAGKTVSSLAWISVWCRQFAANFGDLTVPANFIAPAPLDLGTLGFTNRVHNTYASAVIILNAKQIRVENLVYDGQGPRAYFWVGPGGTPNNDGDYAIPDETGSTGVINAYNGETITLTFPEGTDIFDIGHFGLWCIAFTQDFGHVDIPSQGELNIPPAPLTAGGGEPTRLTFPNCETLVEDELQVSWMINGTDIVIRLSSTNDVGDYVAFGLSGSTTGTLMVGGDVVVTFKDDMENAYAIDYYLEGQAQCSPQNGGGACPDTISSTQDGNNNAELVESYVEKNDTVTNIVYRRPLAASDATYDKSFTTDGPIYVIWARGPINGDGRVAYHNVRRPPQSSNLQINFGRPSSTCPPLGQGASVPPVTDGWKIPGIEELETATFTVEMGLSGGSKGYEYITGRVGWGIAWFINGQLIPELTLRRNVTYTFLVSGGDDPVVSGNYHPFYITDDVNGGYAQLTEADQQGITIYAGPEEGPLCQYMSSADPNSYSTFEDYKTTLTKDCAPGDPGVLEWTVPIDAPDLLYYQCYTHRFLGWKIHVTDSATAVTDSATTVTDSATNVTDSATTVSLSVFNIVLLYLLYLIL